MAWWNAADDGRVMGVHEKSRSNHWINAGFMVFEHACVGYVQGDDNVALEKETAAAPGCEGHVDDVSARRLLQSMDTFKDTQALSDLWKKVRHGKVW